MRNTFAVICGLLCILAVVACSDDTPTSPGAQPRIVNNTDTFEFQVTSMQNYSSVWRYNWTTTGTIADVDQSSVVGGGTVVLRLVDADGTIVYSRNLAQDGSYTSESGATGQWRVEIEMSKCSGTLNFRVQKNQ
jgi:hypothetical protein